MLFVKQVLCCELGWKVRLMPTLLACCGIVHAEDVAVQEPQVVQVSATKQTATEHRVAASVTVMPSAELEQRRPHSVSELWQLTPNVTQFTDKPNGQLWVRGIGAGELPRFGGEENPTRGRHPAIVLYVDGAPVDAERGLAAFDDPLDLQQLELLRGPQGTLYGRNALGGVVVMQSRDPGFNAELSGRIYYGTDNELRATAAGGGPLTEQFALRLAAGYSTSSGSLTNVTTDDDETAGWDRFQARGKALLMVSDDVEMRLTVAGTRYEGSTDVWVPFNRKEQRETVTNSPGDDTINGLMSALQTDWHIDRHTKLTAVVGVSRADQDVVYDGDRSARDLTSTDGSNSATTTSLEIRVAQAEAGPLNWLTGIYAARERIDYKTATRFSGDPITQSLGNPAPIGTPYYLSIGQPEHYQKASETIATSAALFTEGTYNFDQHWAATVGLRVSYEDSALDWQQQQQSTIPSLAAPDGAYAWSGKRDEVVVLPKVALAYYVDDERMVYGSVTQGYRAGGLNANATSQASAQLEYDPEFTWNYEVGVRSLWIERQLAFHITGFYVDWRDQQVFTERLPFDVVQTNAARSHILGAEAELRWRSRSGLGLWINGGVIEAEFDERVGQEFQSIGGGAFAANQIDYAGNEFAHIPTWTWAIGGSYHHVSGLFVRSDVHGHSATFADDKNQNRTDAVVIIDARIGYAQNWWSLAIVGRNLSDEVDVLTSVALPGDFIYTAADSTYVRLAPSRSFGLEASAWW